MRSLHSEVVIQWGSKVELWQFALSFFMRPDLWCPFLQCCYELQALCCGVFFIYLLALVPRDVTLPFNFVLGRPFVFLAQPNPYQATFCCCCCFFHKSIHQAQQGPGGGKNISLIPAEIGYRFCAAPQCLYAPAGSLPASGRETGVIPSHRKSSDNTIIWSLLARVVVWWEKKSFAS